ncbi:hypothetical protein DCAR_0830954 [Daucus carota subsp. sativus]|uniref:Uncharacterized protein n=1 Tax=Daucus carota subsp. sativus TaxID=79200 RepID=A0AAF1BBY1_DAUCS|nr:hypothetical protein DCAR_0830954 [Daucus carota subsp. sativus]
MGQQVRHLLQKRESTSDNHASARAARGMAESGPSFGRFPPTQSTEIPRIHWWISPTTQQQCGI